MVLGTSSMVLHHGGFCPLEDVVVSGHIFVVTAQGMKAADISCTESRYPANHPSVYRTATFKDSFDSEISIITPFYGWKMGFSDVR